MNVSLSADEIGVILESLKYSKQSVVGAQDTPADVRRQNLERIEAIVDRLRSVLRESTKRS